MTMITKTKALNIEHKTNVGRIRITALEVTVFKRKNGHYIVVSAKLKAVRLKDGKEYRRTVRSDIEGPNCLNNIYWMVPINGRGRCPIWED